MSQDELSARLDKQDALLQSIHTALVGNPSLGNKGLVKRVELIEERVEGHNHKLIAWGGAVTGIGFFLGYLKEKLFS